MAQRHPEMKLITEASTHLLLLLIPLQKCVDEGRLNEVEEGVVPPLVAFPENSIIRKVLIAAVDETHVGAIIDHGFGSRNQVLSIEEIDIVNIK